MSESVFDAGGMPAYSGSLVTRSDGDCLEVRARTAGPAGAIGIDLPADGLSLELDGADINELVEVRLELDGELTVRQENILRALFGRTADLIIARQHQQRPTRLQGTRGVSYRSGEVARGLSAVVTALDELERDSQSFGKLDDAQRAVLALQALLGAQDIGLHLPSEAQQSLLALLENLPRDIARPAISGEYQMLLREARQAGLVRDAHAWQTHEAVEHITHYSQTAFHESGPLLASSAPEGAVSAYTARGYGVTAGAVGVQLDPSSNYVNDVRANWLHQCTLEIRIPESDSEQWARIRDNTGTVIAATPMLAGEGWRSGLLLVPRHGELILDIVSGLDARVLDLRVAALGRAYEYGRQAARNERLGDAVLAELLWSQAATWHRIAEDSPREKLAISRRVAANRMSPLLSDGVLGI